MTKKASWEERIYLTYTSILLLSTKSRQELTGQEPEAGADAEAMEGCCLLACSSWLAQFAFL